MRKMVCSVLMFFILSIPSFLHAEEIALKDAIRALDSLESATTSGILYRDYLTRLADAQAAMDRATRIHSESTDLLELHRALGYYRRAAFWWQEKLSRSSLLVIKAREKAEVESCRSLQILLRRTPEEWEEWANSRKTIEERRRDIEFKRTFPTSPEWDRAGRTDAANLFTVALSVSALWECASHALIEARQRIHNKR